MTNEQRKMVLDDAIIQGIQTARSEDVPNGFSERVMLDLEPKRPGVWARLKVWLVRPRVLTVRPLTAIPAVTLAVALLALAIVKMDSPVPEQGIRMTPVRFIMHDKTMRASQVSVIGSFNNWRAERSVMWYSTEEGAWVLEAQLPPGDHEYLFLVNGEELVSDPGAPMTRDDGFGNRNSIMFVKGDNEQVL